jgi:hypothetical protein
MFLPLTGNDWYIYKGKQEMPCSEWTCIEYGSQNGDKAIPGCSGYAIATNLANGVYHLVIFPTETFELILATTGVAC